MRDIDFVTLLNDAVKQNKPVDKVFRLYYNKDSGKPINYSMQEQEGDFILITKSQYAESRYDVIVRDNKIVKIESIEYSRKLVISKDGKSCHRSNVLIIDPDSDTKWKVKTFISE